MKITSKPFLTTSDDDEIRVYTLENNNGIKVRIINFGATIIGIDTPDKNGVFSNILLTYNRPEEYLDNIYYLGATVGRVCNRIERAKFQLAGRQVNVEANLDNVHHIHGGSDGFSYKVWNANVLSDSVQPVLSMSYISPDGEAGFPGQLQVTVLFYLNNDDELVIEYKANTNKETVVNLTNHSYFNLSGKESISDHEIRINADSFLEMSPEGLPTGKILNVEGSSFDLRKFKKFGDLSSYEDEQIKQFNGFDHNFIVNDSVDKFVAEVRDLESGRMVKVYSSEPGVQLYTANSIDEEASKYTAFKQHCAFCLETQHFPNSPNVPYFPSVVIKPGDKFKSKTVFKFSDRQSDKDAVKSKLW